LNVAESQKQDEALNLLRELTKSTNVTILAHKEILGRHERDLVKVLESLKNHADAIEVLRDDLVRLAALPGWGWTQRLRHRCRTKVLTSISLIASCNRLLATPREVGESRVGVFVPHKNR
jgi:hypothetical protein